VTEVYTKEIPSDDPLLGRNVEHDPRSRAYAYRRDAGATLRSARHRTHLPTLDQHVGSCTCNTVLKLISYDQHWPTLTAAQRLAIGIDPNALVDDLYRETTRNDEFDGAWEPNDTGSSGTSASKTIVRRGWAKGFQHTFSLDDALFALSDWAVGLGAWWYSSFDNPSNDGGVTLTASARRRGGHEFVLDEIDVENQIVWGQNSWGDDFGIDGRFWFPWRDLERLLDEDGDIVRLVPLDEPAPEPNWDLMLAKPLRDWAYGRTLWSRVTKAGKARAAAVEWLTRKGL
jgi:hypothetical protein